MPRNGGNPSRTVRRALRRILDAWRGNDGTPAKKTYSIDDLRRDQAEFDEWRRRNPDKPLKHFSVEQMEAALAAGGVQSTLGARLRDGSYEDAGRRFFERLREYGLKEGDTCVDYGCGTLRIGQHIIKFLGPGKYWGLDISQKLLDEGQRLIRPEIWAAKEPRMRVIGADSVAEAAAAKPDMLFSTSVMQHVFPDDLPEYIENIMTIIGRSGQAIIDSRWSEGGAVQYGQRSWAHDAARIGELVSRMDGEMIVLKYVERPLPLEGAGNVKRGAFRLVHKSSSLAGRVG